MQLHGAFSKPPQQNMDSPISNGEGCPNQGLQYHSLQTTLGSKAMPLCFHSLSWSPKPHRAGSLKAAQAKVTGASDLSYKGKAMAALWRTARSYILERWQISIRCQHVESISLHFLAELVWYGIGGNNFWF